MLREALYRIGDEFPAAKQGRLANNDLASYIRSDAPAVVLEALGEQGQGLITAGSPGQGKWADVPWLAVFYPVITDSATQGYYVVYLFNTSERTVYLSLNQGTTAVQSEFGTRRSHDVLRDRAALMRARVQNFANQFDTTPISLGSNLALPKGYESGHALGRKYQLDRLPPESQLQEDLRKICQAYLALEHRGGLNPSIAAEGGENEIDERDTASMTVEEIRRYKAHKRIERNPKAVKLAKKGREPRCQACDFEFTSMYGDLGAGYVEAHHLRPLSTLLEGEAAQYNVVEDFALLCSNCHRMIHRMEDPSDLDGLRDRIERARQP